MKSLYESILDIDGNITMANDGIKEVEKAKSIVYNFINDLLNTNKYEFELRDNWITVDKFSHHKYLKVSLSMIKPLKDDTQYYFFEYGHTIITKYKSRLQYIKAALNISSKVYIAHSGVTQSTMVDINDPLWSVFVNIIQDNIDCVFGEMFIDTIEKLLKEKNIKNV